MPATLLSAPGRGPVLVLVHGWMHSPRVWGSLARELPGDWTVVCPNLDGFGGSPRFAGPSGACLDRLARSLLERLSPPSLEAQRTICAGDSLGAIVLLHLALAGSLSVPLYLLGAPAFGLPGWLSLPGSATLAGPALRLLRTLPASVASSSIGWASRLTFARATRHRELLLEMAVEADPRAAQEALTALQRLREKPLSLHRLPQPCRVARGEKDRLVRRTEADRLAKALGADMDEIPEAGHTPMLENPRALAESLVRFHRELSDARSLR